MDNSSLVLFVCLFVCFVVLFTFSPIPKILFWHSVVNSIQCQVWLGHNEMLFHSVLLFCSLGIFFKMTHFEVIVKIV